MSNEITEQELIELYNREVPFDQIKASGEFEIPSGYYIHTAVNFKPSSYQKDSDSPALYLIEAEITSHAADTANARPFTRKWRLFIGTNADPKAQLPETAFTSSGYGLLKAWGEVCGVPTNKQPEAVLCNALLGKRWVQYLGLGKPNKKTGNKFTEFQRKPVPVGKIPAKLDSDAGRTGGVAPMANGGMSPALTGATFGTE